MKIYIVGSGGIGGYFGGLLAKSGQDVTFVARGAHYEAIQNNGLKVQSETGDFHIYPAQVIKSIAEITQPDLVIFSVKTYDTEEVAKQLKKVVNSKTVIITFQNGVANDLIIKKIIHSENVYPGVAYIITTKIQPGVIKQTGGLAELIIGDRINPTNEQLNHIKKIMKDAGIVIELSNNIVKELWKKFIFIVAFSGMTALCRNPLGKILSDPTTKYLYERCIKEAIEVAKANEVDIEERAFENTMITTAGVTPDSKTSLLVDIENNRKNEIETLNGTIVKMARDKHISVPINETIYGAIKLL